MTPLCAICANRDASREISLDFRWIKVCDLCDESHPREGRFAFDDSPSAVKWFRDGNRNPSGGGRTGGGHA